MAKTTFRKTFKRHLHLLCEHCKYGWYPRSEEIPKVCPECKYELENPTLEGNDKIEAATLAAIAGDE